MAYDLDDESDDIDIGELENQENFEPWSFASTPNSNSSNQSFHEQPMNQARMKLVNKINLFNMMNPMNSLMHSRFRYVSNYDINRRRYAGRYHVPDDQSQLVRANQNAEVAIRFGGCSSHGPSAHLIYRVIRREAEIYVPYVGLFLRALHTRQIAHLPSQLNGLAAVRSNRGHFDMFSENGLFAVSSESYCYHFSKFEASCRNNCGCLIGESFGLCPSNQWWWNCCSKWPLCPCLNIEYETFDLEDFLIDAIVREDAESTLDFASKLIELAGYNRDVDPDHYDLHVHVHSSMLSGLCFLFVDLPYSIECRRRGLIGPQADGNSRFLPFVEKVLPRLLDLDALDQWNAAWILNFVMVMNIVLGAAPKLIRIVLQAIRKHNARNQNSPNRRVLLTEIRIMKNFSLDRTLLHFVTSPHVPATNRLEVLQLLLETPIDSISDEGRQIDVFLDPNAQIRRDLWWSETPLMQAIRLTAVPTDEESNLTRDCSRLIHTLVDITGAPLQDRFCGRNSRPLTATMPESNHFGPDHPSVADAILCMKMLLAHGANPNLPADTGMTPLMMAVQVEGHLHQVAMYLTHEGIYDPVAPASDWFAATPHRVKLLLEAGAEVDLQTRDGFTALMYACIWNQFDLIQILLEAGADINLCTNLGWDAMHFAAINRIIQQADGDIEWSVPAPQIAFLHRMQEQYPVLREFPSPCLALLLSHHSRSTIDPRRRFELGVTGETLRDVQLLQQRSPHLMQWFEKKDANNYMAYQLHLSVDLLRKLNEELLCYC